MDRGQFLIIPPSFDGTNYAYWKLRGVLSQITKNKTYTNKNTCSGVSKDRSHGECLA